MIAVDFKTLNGDMVIKGGDFDTEQSDEQHIEDILISEPGYWRQFPLLGVGVRRQLNAPFTHTERINFQKGVKLQLEYDNYKVNKVLAEAADTMNIDAERNMQ